MTASAATPTRQRDGLSPLRLHVLVATMVVAGTGCVLVALLAIGSTSGTPALWRIGLSALVVAVGDFGGLHIRFGRETCTLTWSEAAILISLVLAPWPWIIIVGPIAVAVSQLAARRAPLKIAFNAGSMAAGATLAAVCVHLIAGRSELESVPGVISCVALAAATAVYFAWNTASVSMVIAAAGGMRLRDIWQDGLALKLGMLVGNTVIALLLVRVAWRGSVSVLVAFCVILLFLTYRAYHRATEESDVWRQLDAAAKELTPLDGAQVANAAVVRAVSLFKADYAELVLGPQAGAGTQVFRHDTSGPSTAEVVGHDAEGGAVPSSETVVVEAALAVTVDGDSAVIGVLRLGMREPGHLSKRQQVVLRTFAHSVATSLQNARLYAEMRHQADVNAFEATHDPLTGIANRKVLSSVLATAVEEAAHTRMSVGLLLIDLDHFKDINDTLGHHAGDAVLCAVAQRLSGAISGQDLVARLGGDEFAVVVRGIRTPADAETIANRLLLVLAEAVEYEGLLLAIGGSIGIACCPEDGTNPDDLLRLADTALYQAKQPRGAVSRYSRDRDDNSLGKITLAAELRNAISSQQFVLHYQPQVDLASGRVVGTEALARWRHPSRGLLYPDAFIDLVERSGLVHEFALNILDAAIAEAATWNLRGIGVPVSVNLSARNLRDPRLPGVVAEILLRHGLPPNRLVLELTETTMITDAEQVEAVLARLRRVGVQLSVDDFGTGYSSLAFLQRVAVNEIKIDRSFVLAMTESESDAVIVRATIDLAHGLGVRVVAEGVETAEHVRALRALGCDVAQGWHFGKPVPAPHLRAAWLNDSRRARNREVIPAFAHQADQVG